MSETTTNDTLRGNIEAALRLLLKSEKDYLRRAAEVGIEDLGLLVARLDEKLSVESADDWLAHRFNEVYDEKKRLEEQLETLQAAVEGYWAGDDSALVKLRLRELPSNPSSKLLNCKEGL